MFKFSFSNSDECFEVPTSYDEELMFSLVENMPLAVFLNRKYIEICVFGDLSAISAIEFQRQFNAWFKDFKESCPCSVYVQLLLREPETYAVCIHNKWIKTRYLPFDKL